METARVTAVRKSSGLWPLHLKPKDDELLSSWLVRLARAHRLKLHTFCSLTWPRKQIWNRDIDNSTYTEVLEVLSAKTGTSFKRVRATTLAAYEDVLYEKHNTLLPTSWILPIGVYHRIHKQFGLQYCPLCLADDKEPYYRRKWRLAFIVSCERHQTLLHDRCPHCGAAINFHRNKLGDYRKLTADSLILCHVCRSDLRVVKRHLVSSVTSTETEFTDKLLKAMDAGFVRLSESVAISSQLYFVGLRQLMKITAMQNRRIDELRRAISEELGVVANSPSTTRSRRDVQEMDVEERRKLLGFACYLLGEWPNRFIKLSQRYRIWSSIWLRHLDPPARASNLRAPFWLWSVVHDNLYRAKYCPSNDEIRAAVQHLEGNGNVVNKSKLARILGVAVVRR